MSKIIKYENITPDQVALIKSQIAVDATDDELKLFLHVANKSGLDPLARQIYFIKRGGKMTIMTAIDGFRAIADRTGQYIGSSDPVFEDNGSIPAKATVTVNKVVSGIVGNFTATARWDEYYPGKSQGFMWDKMPHTMLGKCAEALALRKAFPAQLSGLYTGDEMDQAQNDGKKDTTPPKEVNPTGGSEQLKEQLTEPEVSTTQYSLEVAQKELDEEFAFCDNETLRTTILNTLDDNKFIGSEATEKTLVEFAQSFPANRARFQKLAHDRGNDWKENMPVKDWNALTKYMTVLDNIYQSAEKPPVEEVL